MVKHWKLDDEITKVNETPTVISTVDQVIGVAIRGHLNWPLQ